MRYGSKAGIVSTLGINIGSIVAILIAAFGLSSLLEIYPNAIIFIQIIGGFYIIYLAILMWPRDLILNIDEWSLAEGSYRNLFKNGFITSVLNPKDILFYTVFIPTFIPQGVVGKHFDVRSIWQNWCNNLKAVQLPWGHFIPEEAPSRTLSELNDFLT